MQTSFYNALFASLPQERNLANISNNLSNVNTTGYKKEKFAFKDMVQRNLSDIMDPRAAIREESPWPQPNLIARCEMDSGVIDFSEGAMVQTSSPLDLAIQGEGFFSVETDAGTAYTRNGHFSLSAEGELITGGGDRVLAGGGPLIFPAGTKVVSVGEDGSLFADGAEVGRLDIVTFADPQVLEKAGGNLFRLKQDAAGQEGEFQGRVMQGFLEGSNVDVVQEMVGMMTTLRTFESYQKVIKSTQEMDERAIRDVGTTK
ncbi:MAG: flagellar basal-body rod protein FlgF [Desulfovibrionales bacterium]